MGSFDKLIGLIPGLEQAKIPESVLVKQEEKMNHWKSAISSMTEEEIENPEILEKQTNRISRIAKGSGTTTGEIRELLKQYKMLNSMMHSGIAEKASQGNMSQQDMMKLAKKFKGKIKI